MKRAISFLLALAITLSFAPAMTALDPPVTFDSNAGGELAAWLGTNPADLGTALEFTVTGDLNDADLLALSAARTSFTALKILDLEEVSEETAGDLAILPDSFWNFYGGSTPLETVKLPDCITTIGYAAFYECVSLMSVSMPEVTSIGLAAFDGCTALQSVSMPEVTSIGGNAFYRCDALQSVSMPEAITIANSAFHNCTALQSVSMPEVTTIGTAAFRGCTALQSVSMPEATSIGDATFSGCTALQSVSMPKVTSIGHSAFLDCTALHSISMPEVTTIGNAAFRGCTALTSVSMPKATSIGIDAFVGCTALTSVSMPEVTSIGDDAFAACTSLRLVYLGGQTVAIDTLAFSGVPADALLLYSGSAPTGGGATGRTFYHYPLSLSARVGESVTLGAGLSGYTGAGLSFEWCKGWTSLGSGLTRTLSNLATSNAGGYYLEVTIDGEAYLLPEVTLDVEGSGTEPNVPQPNVPQPNVPQPRFQLPGGGSGGNETWPSLPPPVTTEEKANPGMGGR